MPTPTSFKDAQGLNNIERNVRQYRDLDLFFIKKKLSSKDSGGVVTVSGAKADIETVTDITAVKRSIRNLVLTNHYEKPFHPEIGCGVRELLFELMTPLTAHLLTRKVEDVITQYEPRAQLVGVRATPDLDRNAYELTIEFYVLNAPTELVDLTVLLERLR